MAGPKGVIVVDEERCKGCGLCAHACPNDVIGYSKQVNRKGYHFAFMKNADACTGCSNCGIICPDGVITVYKEKKPNG